MNIYIYIYIQIYVSSRGGGRHLFDFVIISLSLIALGPINLPVKALRVAAARCECCPCPSKCYTCPSFTYDVNVIPARQSAACRAPTAPAPPSLGIFGSFACHRAVSFIRERCP